MVTKVKKGVQREYGKIKMEGKQMYIANPTYDVVFKYLLDDNKIAKKLLSLIIGKEIITLDYKPTEYRGNLTTQEISDNNDFNHSNNDAANLVEIPDDVIQKQRDLNSISLTLLHIDFSALIQLEDGTRQHIIIELQKATYFADIMRFRRYLGTQYAHNNNFYLKDGKKVAMPIFSIYFLCDYLKHTKVPVIKVDRTYYDAATGEVLKEKEDFIEGLTHDSIIIQTPALKTHRRNLLEEVLSVFSSGQDGNRLIDVSEMDYPKEYKEVIRRLLQAGAEKKIRDTMIMEDEYIAEFKEQQRALAIKDDIITTKDDIITTKDDIIANERKALAKEKQASAKKDDIIALTKEHLENAAKNIANAMGISLEEAKKIINK